MRPASFDYVAPKTLPDACRILADLGPDARVLAGGQSLIPAMTLRVAYPSALVDLRHLHELRSIMVRDGVVSIGALTTHAELLLSADLRRALPVLPEVAHHIAHAAIRSRGTFGGSLANADPASEWPAVLLALEGRVKVVSRRGERWIGADDFLQGVFTTALEPDEILTQVDLPIPGPQERVCFEEYARQSGAFAVAIAIARVWFEGAQITKTRLVVGACGERPVAPDIDWSPLLGSAPSDVAIDQIVTQVDGAIEPQGDPHFGPEDRRQIALVMVRRALTKAVRRHAQPG
jgi:carbon-monoxide dehydrogenase medium subunit